MIVAFLLLPSVAIAVIFMVFFFPAFFVFTLPLDVTVAYFQRIHAPVCFTELGIGVQTDETLHALAHACTSKTGGKTGFFKRLSEEDVYEIYRAANH